MASKTFTISKTNTLFYALKSSSKAKLAFYLKRISCIVILFGLIFVIVMASGGSDVDHLRQQYNAGKSQHDKLVVQYHNKQFHDGDELKKADTQTAPRVQINIDVDPQNPYFTLIMADPDAPQRGHEVAGPWLHWIQACFKGNDLSSGKTLADYQGPAPPSGTGPHQYIFLLYKSAKDDSSRAGASIPVSDSGKRKQFHLKKFEKDHQLQLVATTSYTVIG